MASSELILSIDDFEKTLLHDFCETFRDGRQRIVFSHPQLLQREVFKRWRWTHTVYDHLSSALYSKELCHFHEGDRRRIWELFLRRLEGFPLTMSYFSKVAHLKEHNPRFPQTFVDQTTGLPSLVERSEDQHYWQLIADMFFANQIGVSTFSDITTFPINLSTYSEEFLHIQEPKPYPEPGSGPVGKDDQEGEGDQQGRGGQKGKEDQMGETDQQSKGNASLVRKRQGLEFEIWSLVRMCSMLERGGCRSDKIWEALQQCGFNELYDCLENGFIRRDLNEPGYLKAFAIEDPSYFVEFIPWTDLEITTSVSIPKWLNDPPRFARWHPSKATKFDHHLRTDEETYRFCVDLDIYWPNHLDNGHVLFALLPLRDSKFISELGYFWKDWNDCAITQDPNTQEWLLLQTIPGLKFHHISKSQNWITAIKHFCHIMDELRFGRPEQLQDILGLPDQLDSERLIDIMPFEQIVSVDRTPLGQGERGVVYKATWSCPQKSDMPAPEEITVALKAMKAGKPDDLKHFFRELDLDLKALQGWSIGGVRFFGVTKTPSTSPLEHSIECGLTTQSLSTALPQNTLVLVLEYAERGGLLNYLDGTLKGNSADWTIIFNLMIDVATCLHQLHKAGVIHRDLHENNVLVTKQLTPADPKKAEFYKPKISDLSESTLSTVPTSGRIYGDQDSWAPEVRLLQKYSTASDVYSIGWIFAKMVKLKWDRTAALTGEKNCQAPKRMIDIIRWCTKPEPEERPESDELLGEFEAVYVESEEDMDNNMVFEMVELDPDTILHPARIEEEIPS